jgi:hypothetical protein
VVVRRDGDPRELGHLDPLIEVLLDVVHGLVQPLQHPSPPSLSDHPR